LYTLIEELPPRPDRVTGMSEVVADFRIQHYHTPTEVSRSESPPLHLQAKKGDRDAQALREIGERPAELGIGMFSRIGG